MEVFGHHNFTARAPRKNRNRWCALCGDPITPGDLCAGWACSDDGRVSTVEGHLACIGVWKLEPRDERREWYGAYYYEDNDEGRERCRAALRKAGAL